MSRFGPTLRCALAFALLFACRVPSLKELEAERPRACDDAHPCGAGYGCVEGACRSGASLECQAGESAACGSAVGSCVEGRRVCDAQGKWGVCVGEVGPAQEVCNGQDDDCNSKVDDAIQGPLCALQQGICAGKRVACVGGTMEPGCTATHYGADYEPAESRCDGKDNDCDGQQDEGLFIACSNQKGVCQGSRSTCANGAYPDCTAGTYSAFSSAFEAAETRCDGLDNDCDGLVDLWAAANLSQSAAVSRKAAAVALGTDVLALFEEGQKVSARVARSDGTFGPSQLPSSSLAGASNAYAPALAADGALVAAAWVEERPAKTVTLATLDSTGKSNLTGGGAMQILTSGVPVALAIAVDAASGRLLVAIEDASTPSTIKVVGYPTVLPPGSAVTFTRDFIAPGGRKPQVAAGTGGTFYVAWEGPAGIERRAVDAAGAVTTLTSIGAAGDRNPQLFHLSGGGNDVVTYFFTASSTLGDDQIVSVACDASSCAAPQPFGNGHAAGMQDLRLAAPSKGAPPTLAVWDEGLATVVVRFRAVNASGGNERVGTLSPSGSLGLRPVPAILDGGVGAAVFDTEGNTGGGVPGNEVFVARLCLP